MQNCLFFICWNCLIICLAYPETEVHIKHPNILFAIAAKSLMNVKNFTVYFISVTKLTSAQPIQLLFVYSNYCSLLLQCRYTVL